MYRRLRWIQLSACLALCSGPLAWGANTQKDAALNAYKEMAQTVKDDDDAGYLRLYQWCQGNGLKDEASSALDKYRNIYYSKCNAKLVEKPARDGIQGLISWCVQYGWQPKADELKRRLLVMDFQDRSAKLKPDDVGGLETLATWCKTNALPKEASATFQNIVKLQPDHAKARAELGFIKLQGAWLDEEAIATKYVALDGAARDEFYKSAQTAGFKAPRTELDQYVEWSKSPTGLLKDQKLKGHSEEDAWYHVQVPAEYGAFKEPLPLVIFLHGGSDKAGSANDWVATAQTFKIYQNCIVVFPNHLKGLWGWTGKKELLYVFDTISEVLKRWRVDRHRIYLAGHSMGGNGVWGVGTRMHELFAAISPQSGFWEPFFEFPMQDIINKPIYILHGTKDTTVPIDSSRKAYHALKTLGAPQAELHELDCAHAVPEGEVEKAVEWLFQFRNAEEFDLAKLHDKLTKLAKPKGSNAKDWE